MAVTEIGTGVSGTANLTIAVATTQNVPAGKHLVALLTYNSDKATLGPTIGDNSGGSHVWQEDDEASQSGNNGVMAFSTKAISQINSGTIVTVTFLANASRKTLRLLLVDDLASTSWLIENGRATGSNASSVSATTDAAVSGDIQFITLGSVNTGTNLSLAFTAGGSYSEIGSELVAGGSATRSGFAAQRSVTGAASGTETGSGTTDRTTGWAMVILAYRRASAGISKTGGFSSPAKLGGSKAVFNASSKQGGLFVGEPTIGEGSKTVAFVKTGGFRSAARLGAVGQGGIARSGGFQSTVTISGTGVKTFLFTKSGGKVSATRIGGGKKTNAAGPWSATFAFNFPAAVVRTGGMTSPGSLGATKLLVFTVAKTGGFTSAVSRGGSATYTVSRSFGVRAPAVLGLSKTWGTVKTGQTSSPVRLGGTRAYSVSRAGGFTSAGRLGGAGTISAATAKSGGMTSPARLGVAKTVTFAKTGGMTSALTAGGPRAHSYAKSGGVLGVLSSSASRTYRYTRASEFRSVASMGAAATTTGFIVKTGGTRSAASAGGTQGRVYAKAGGMSSASVAGASKAVMRIAIRTGGMSSTLTTSASKNWTVTNTGGYRSAAKIGGLRLGFNVQGGTRSAGRLGGGVATARTITATLGLKHSIVSTKMLDAKLIGAKVDA